MIGLIRGTPISTRTGMRLRLSSGGLSQSPPAQREFRDVFLRTEYYAGLNQRGRIRLCANAVILRV